MNIKIRKKIAKLKKILLSTDNREEIITKICELREVLKSDLPTLGQFRQVIEQDVKEEQQELLTQATPTDLKRVALKEAIRDFYNDLAYDPESTIVDYEGSLRLRRDNKKQDITDMDFAPDYSKIYAIYMDKIQYLVRHSRLSKAEMDEQLEAGVPQGGSFERQLIRLIKDYMRKLWKKE